MHIQSSSDFFPVPDVSEFATVSSQAEHGPELVVCFHVPIGQSPQLPGEDLTPFGSEDPQLFLCSPGPHVSQYVHMVFHDPSFGLNPQFGQGEHLPAEDPPQNSLKYPAGHG